MSSLSQILVFSPRPKSDGCMVMPVVRPFAVEANPLMACGAAASSEATRRAAGVPELVTPPSNTGVNETKPVARGVNL